MSNQGYYAAQPQPVYYPPGPQQGYAPQPQYYNQGGPPQQMQYQQAQPVRQKSNRGFLEICLATLCCCCVAEEGCECCADCCECAEGCC